MILYLQFIIFISRMIKKNKSLNLFDLLFYIIYVTHIHHIS